MIENSKFKTSIIIVAIIASLLFTVYGCSSQENNTSKTNDSNNNTTIESTVDDINKTKDYDTYHNSMAYVRFDFDESKASEEDIIKLINDVGSLDEVYEVKYMSKEDVKKSIEDVAAKGGEDRRESASEGLDTLDNLINPYIKFNVKDVDKETAVVNALKNNSIADKVKAYSSLDDSILYYKKYSS